MAISKKISELDVLTSPQDLTKLFPPLFAQDGSPLNIRMSMAEVLKSAAQVAINSGTLTGSSSPALSITQTWNNAATTFTGALINVTDTASNAASRLLDLQTGASSRAYFDKGGVLTIPATSTNRAMLKFDISGSAGLGGGTTRPNSMSFYSSTGSEVVRMEGILGGLHALGPDGFWLGVDVNILRDAADVLALRRTSNAEILRVYETYTDATTFSRGVFGFRDSASGGTGTGSATTVLRIGTEKGSVGGTEKGISFVTDGTERGGFLTGGNGFFSSNGFNFQNSTTGSNLTLHSGNILVKSNDAYNFKVIGSTELRLPSTASLTFANGTSFAGTVDTAITRPAANILGITNGSTGPGTLAIDNVQGTNFERLKMEWDTNVARIGTSKGGSGTARDFAIITDNAVRVTFAAAGGQTAADGHNMAFGTSTGTKIGTATGQKIGFWNATPVVQQVLATGAGATVDNVITLLQTLGLCKQS